MADLVPLSYADFRIDIEMQVDIKLRPDFTNEHFLGDTSAFGALHHIVYSFFQTGRRNRVHKLVNGKSSESCAVEQDDSASHQGRPIVCLCKTWATDQGNRDANCSSD